MEWVREKFGEGWASECDVAFSMQPVTYFIAVKDKQLIGFACLNAMHDMGYAYAVTGSAGPVDFYRTTVGAAQLKDQRLVSTGA